MDNASLRTVPEYPEVVTVITALNQAQVAAGFSHVEVRPLPIDGTGDNPPHYRDFSQVFVDIFASVEGLLGPAMAPTIRVAAERIRALPEIPGSELHYAPVVASATRVG